MFQICVICVICGLLLDFDVALTRWCCSLLPGYKPTILMFATSHQPCAKPFSEEWIRMTTEYIDVLIVGAGLSGICAAYYLQTRCPAKSYAILEGRGAIGGTWDLFRYPD